jgi:hypothetical protein
MVAFVDFVSHVEPALDGGPRDASMMVAFRGRFDMRSLIRERSRRTYP